MRRTMQPDTAGSADVSLSNKTPPTNRFVSSQHQRDVFARNVLPFGDSHIGAHQAGLVPPPADLPYWVPAASASFACVPFRKDCKHEIFFGRFRNSLETSLIARRDLAPSRTFPKAQAWFPQRGVHSHAQRRQLHGGGLLVFWTGDNPLATESQVSARCSPDAPADQSQQQYDNNDGPSHGRLPLSGSRRPSSCRTESRIAGIWASTAGERPLPIAADETEIPSNVHGMELSSPRSLMA